MKKRDDELVFVAAQSVVRPMRKVDRSFGERVRTAHRALDLELRTLRIDYLLMPSLLCFHLLCNGSHRR